MNSDISTLIPHYNWIWIRISILGADTDTDEKNSDNHFHIPTLRGASLMARWAVADGGRSCRRRPDAAPRGGVGGNLDGT